MLQVLDDLLVCSNKIRHSTSVGLQSKTHENLVIHLSAITGMNVSLYVFFLMYFGECKKKKIEMADNIFSVG